MREKSIIKAVLIFIGILCFVIGSIGVFIPILPTVPFLLIASVCFMKSSEELDSWFKNTNLYKDNIEALVKNRSMSRSSKKKILTTISVFMILGYVFMKDVLIGKLCLIFIWLFHFIYFIFIIKTQEDEDFE